MNLKRLKTVVALLLAAHCFEAKSDVTLAWNPSVTVAPVTNYIVYWGTQSGFYLLEAYAGTQTNLTVTGLAPNTVYYFAVTATDQNGMESVNSGEIVFTNAPSNMPPNPTGTNAFGGGGGSNNVSSNTLGGGGGGGSSTNGGGSSSEFPVAGVPPTLTITFTNQHPMLTISGTISSTLTIQSSTNPAILSSWNTITNLAMTNLAAAGPSNQSSPSVLNLAFAPATQNYAVLDAAPPTAEFYQVVMPYDYMVLADAVLSGQGYPSRLVLVRMPGIAADDICYVTPQSSFLFYDAANRAFALEPSGSTIRQIADTLSTSLSQNWTSASEFAYSNGVSTILATVVETEPSASDPVATASTASIQIDF